MYDRYLKSIIDVVLTIALLLVLSWIIILIHLSYLIFVRGPVFFTQDRIGRNEKVFKVIKYRTLRSTGGAFEARRFWLGDFLRFTSLDEIPQLFNVLNGEMSLVGPRPLPVAYGPLFNPQQRKRHTVKPGLTGLAQINGKNSLSWEKKFEYDARYVKEMSLLLDIKILVATVFLFLSFKKDVSLEEKPFIGNP